MSEWVDESAAVLLDDVRVKGTAEIDAILIERHPIGCLEESVVLKMPGVGSELLGAYLAVLSRYLEKHVATGPEEGETFTQDPTTPPQPIM